MPVPAKRCLLTFAQGRPGAQVSRGPEHLWGMPDSMQEAVQAMGPALQEMGALGDGQNHSLCRALQLRLAALAAAPWAIADQQASHSRTRFSLKPQVLKPLLVSDVPDIMPPTSCSTQPMASVCACTGRPDSW